MHSYTKQKAGTKMLSSKIKMNEKMTPFYQKALKCYEAGLFREAESILKSHVDSNPRDDKALNLLGLVAYKLREYDSAIDLFESAVQLNEQNHSYYHNLGIAFKECKKYKEAIKCLQRTIELNPNNYLAACHLGQSFHKLKEIPSAKEWYNYALNRNPNCIEAYNGIALAFRDQGMVEKAIEVFQEAIKRNLYDALFHSNFLLCLNYLEESDPDIIFKHHRDWELRYASKGKWNNQVYLNDCIPTRRLRVGYVSADFRVHPVAFFMNPILLAHNRRNYEVFCYADVAVPDEMTLAMMPNVEHWKTIHSMSDHQVMDLIRKDRIDILVDLGGHTGNNRMKLFSSKPAPIQVSYLGYPNTTGLIVMDYRITDAVADPPGISDQYYTEKLIRLPGGFLCYQPAKGCPEPAAPPCIENGFVTFGSFNNMIKINSQVIRVWSNLLHRVPGSRLILKSSLDMDEDTRQQLLSKFIENGVSSFRIEIMPYLPFHDHMKQYQKVDIALDTFPYNGTTTTCEALWMGVPVVSLAGKTHVSRVGASILSHLNLDEWIVTSTDDYVKTTAGLANDIENLKSLRRILRKKFQISSLMDKEIFAFTLETAYRRMWFDRCANLISQDHECSDIMTCRLEGGMAVCIPNDINCMTSYVLKERGSRYEREIEFTRNILESGMNMVDIGAGYGIYSLVAATSIGKYGKVWSFEPSRLFSAYLACSVRRNQMSNVSILQSGVSDSDASAYLSINGHSEIDRIIDFEQSDIKEAITMTSLDNWMQSNDEHIDFLRMDGLYLEDKIFKGGLSFFKRFSPLILYKIKHGVAFHLEMMISFQNLGYQSYRLVPGLKIMVPVSPGEKLDACQLYLFCCKADRSEKLRMQGHLINEIKGNPSFTEGSLSLWIDYLNEFSYLLRLLPSWESYCNNHVSDSGWQAHQRALSGYAISQLSRYSMHDRYKALNNSYELMKELLKTQPTVSRILTTIRIANDLGYQEDAVTWLNHLYHFFKVGHEFSVNEPFLAISERMAAIDPGNDVGQWLIYGVLETREHCQAYSSYFTGKKSLPELEMMLTSPYCSEEMKRRHQLIIDRFGTGPEDRERMTDGC